MKFVTALVALASAAVANPINSLESRCGACDYQHESSGYGRYHGEKRHCSNWVPVDEKGIALDVHAQVCLNLDVSIIGLIHLDLSAQLDLDVDVELLHYYYPTCKRLVCDPTYSSYKGQPIQEDKCWTHEMDENKYNKYY
ncbi:hypothetical protein E4U54_003980 [Claviceps lovelessii]|nr:hypothetical protein E4U54_003980 [Claviceps lovelessii]